MLTESQHEARRGMIGSSDAAAIVGYDPFRTPFDVWARLTGRLPREQSEDTKVTELGRFLEAGLLDYAEHILETPLDRHRMFVHPDGARCANLDAWAPVATRPLIVEAKVSGLLGRPEWADEWGEPGTDQLPAHVTLQVHHQFAVTNAQPEGADVRDAVVVALLGFRGFVVYRVPRNDELVATLAEREAAFLDTYVRPNVRPPDLPRMETLRKLLRDTDAPAIEVDPDAVAAWLEVVEQRKAIEAVEEERKRTVLAALGDGERGTCPLGELTYTETTRAGFTVAPTTYRTLRLRKPKKERR